MYLRFLDCYSNVKYFVFFIFVLQPTDETINSENNLVCGGHTYLLISHSGRQCDVHYLVNA